MTTQNAPQPTVDTDAVRAHFRTALRYRTPTAMWTALADIPVLLMELERALTLLSRARIEFANVLAAARATLAAVGEQEIDPLAYLRDEVAEHEPIAQPADDASSNRSSR